MAERKLTNQYVFTVEGETEQWYLEWLMDQINHCEASKYNVSIIAKVQKDPLKYAKGVTSLSTPVITHVCDYESEEEEHERLFIETLDKLKAANEIRGKKFKYRLGYSNFTFELWIVLHKTKLFGSLAHRRQYLAPINRIFDEHFENLKEYKKEDNFKRCLKKLNLDLVRDAVRNAQEMMNNNKANGLTEYEYKGFHYYKDNPSLSIWEAVAKILQDSGLIE